MEIIAKDPLGNETKGNAILTKNVTTQGELLKPRLTISAGPKTGDYYTTDITIRVTDQSTGSRATGIRYKLTANGEEKSAVLSNKEGTIEITTDGIYKPEVWLIGTSESDKSPVNSDLAEMKRDTTDPDIAKITYVSKTATSILLKILEK